MRSAEMPSDLSLSATDSARFFESDLLNLAFPVCLSAYPQTVTLEEGFSFIYSTKDAILLFSDSRISDDDIAKKMF